MKTIYVRIKKLLAALLTIVLVGCASVPIPKFDKSQTPSAKDVATVKRDLERGTHAAAVNWRLAVAGRAYCGKYAEFLVPLNIGSVPPLTPSGEKLAYWKTFHFEEGSAYVTGVLDPEVNAKLKYDRIVAIGKTRLARPLHENVLALLRSEAKRGTLTLTLQRNGKVTIPLKKGCRGYFALLRSNAQSAAFGGEIIVITTGLARYAKDDDELAYLEARELALNNSSAATAVKAAAYAASAITGILRFLVPLPLPFGSTGTWAGRATLAFYEADADRGAFKLMLDAGYDPRAIPAFWSRLEQDKKAVNVALKASDDRKKAWAKMLAAVPQATFERITAARNARVRKVQTAAPANVQAHRIRQVHVAGARLLAPAR